VSDFEKIKDLIIEFEPENGCQLADLIDNLKGAALFNDLADKMDAAGEYAPHHFLLALHALDTAESQFRLAEAHRKQSKEDDSSL